MKKSQIAAALALTYVAGATLPLATVANAAGGAPCVPSVSMSEAKSVTGANIKTILSGIQGRDDYKAYKALVDTIALYGDSTAAKQEVKDLDTAATNATDALSTAENTLKTATEAVPTKKSAADTIAIKKFGTDNYVVPTSEVQLLSEVRTRTIGVYDSYMALMTEVARTGATPATIKDLAVALNAKLDSARQIDITTAFAADKNTVALVKTELQKNTDYSDFEKFFDLQTALTAKANAQADVNTKKPLAEAAVAAQKAVINNVAKLIAQLKAANIVGADKLTAVDTSAENAVKVLNTTTLAGHGLWSTFVAYVEEKAKNLTSGVIATSVYDELAAEIDKVKTNNALDTIKESLLNPKEDYAVCGSNGVISISGLLPTNRVSLIVEPGAKLSGIDYNGLEQAVYSIKFGYKGEIYDINSGNYKVTLQVPQGMNGAKASVYYISGTSRQLMSDTAYDAKTNTITFTTSHFSTYALVGEKSTGSTGGNGGSTGGNGGSTGGKSTTTKTTAKAPNTGLVSDVTSGLTTNVASIIRKNDNGATNEHTVATISIVAAACATFATLVAAVRRFAKRRA